MAQIIRILKVKKERTYLHKEKTRLLLTNLKDGGIFVEKRTHENGGIKYVLGYVCEYAGGTATHFDYISRVAYDNLMVTARFNHRGSGEKLVKLMD